MSTRNRNLGDGRRLLGEGVAEYAESVALAAEERRRLRRLWEEEQLRLHWVRELDELSRAATAATPVELHGVLHDFLAAQETDPEATFYQGECTGFFEQLRCAGLVSAVMYAMHGGSTGRDLSLVSPDGSLAWPVLRYVLANPGVADRLPANSSTRAAWLEYAIHAAVWQTRSNEADRDEAVRLLTEFLREDSQSTRSVRELYPEAPGVTEVPFHEVRGDLEAADRWWLAGFVRYAPALAALSLSRLAPDTPGLCAALGAALGSTWAVSFPGSEESAELGDMAAQTLAQLGARGRPALPQLREAVLDRLRHWFSLAWCAFDAFATLCEDKTEVAVLLDEIAAVLDERAANGPVHTRELAMVANRAGSWPALVPALGRLLRGFAWEDDQMRYDRNGLYAIHLLRENGQASEVLLPALAGALTGYDPLRYGEYRKSAEVEAVRFFDQLSAGGARTEGDAFLVALRGLPHTDFTWLVYADWLDDRDDPRGELVRLRHLCASGDATDDLRESLAAWKATHGDGWYALYDVVAGR